MVDERDDNEHILLGELKQTGAMITGSSLRSRPRRQAAHSADDRGRGGILSAGRA